MKFLLLTLHICFFMSLIWGCKYNKNDKKVEDKFYTTTTSSWDASRIPLLKPYEMLKLNGTQEWTMNLFEIPSSVSNVEEINIYRNIILIHAGETYCNYAKVHEGWFIIIPEKHIEKGFDKKEDFKKYLSSLKIENPRLYSIDKVLEKFKKNTKIDWQDSIE